MSATVLPLSRYRPTPAAPLFIFVDLQREFTLEGRPLQMRGSGPALANCLRLLNLARFNRFPVAHARLTEHAVTFHREERGAEWIDEFKPHGSEMVFERDGPSCYISPAFLNMMEEGGGSSAILAGLAGSTSCLTTLIDAQVSGHNVRYAFDASWSHALSLEDETEMHDAAVTVAAQFVDLIETDEVVATFSRGEGCI
jgi:nicotinamidase-related amidase